MDALITPAAAKDLESFAAFGPGPGVWGVLIGHRRGPRTIVEKVAAGCCGPARPPDGPALARFDAIWPGRVIGLAAVRPGAAFKRAALGPAWYGRIVLTLAGRAASPAWSAFVVEFDGRFFLDPVRIAPAGKERSHE